MLQAKRKPKTKPKPATNMVATSGQEVLTLAEAADYLRVLQEEVVRLARQQGLPGRLLGAEWRFLKSALRDWLRTPSTQGSKEAVLSVAGVWKDDPYLEEELKEIYKRRGRPMTEADE